MYDPRLLNFFQTHGDSEWPIFGVTLRIAAEAFGHWTEPPSAPSATRHAVSHEISLFGVIAKGDTAGEVVRNWHRAATNLLEAAHAEEAARAEVAA